MKLLLTVQYISHRDSRVMDEVGFRIPRVGFRIPGTGFRIPKPWIPDSKGQKILDSGFRILLYRAIHPSTMVDRSGAIINPYASESDLE